MLKIATWMTNVYSQIFRSLTHAVFQEIEQLKHRQ